MKFHIIIVFVLLAIVLFPNFSVGISNYAVANIDAGTGIQSNYYNFTSQPIGYFPANKSWIRFSVVNNSSTTTDYVSKTSLGDALNITTYNFAESSYLQMAVSSYNSTNISLSFDWNNSISAGGVEDNIILEYDNSTVADYYFGPFYQYNSYMKIGNETYSLGYMNTMNKLNDLSFYLSSEFPNSIFFSLTTNTGQLIIPLRFDTPVPYSAGNLSLLIGGDISNLFLYNISDSQYTGNIFPAMSKENLNYNFTTISAPVKSQVPSENSFPYFDEALNTVFYLTNGGDIAYYNYYNGTTSEYAVPKPANPFDFSGIAEDGNFLFYYFNNNYSTELVQINLNNLSFATHNITLGSASSLFSFHYSGYILLLNATGEFVKFYADNLSSISYGQLPFYLEDKYQYTMIDGYVKDGLLNTTALNNSSDVVLEESFRLGNLSEFSYSMLKYPPSIKSMGVLEPLNYNNSIGSTIRPQTASSSELLSVDGSIYSFYEGANASVSFANNNSAVISSGNHYWILSKSGSLTATNLPASDNESACFSSNLSEGVLISTNAMVIFYKESTVPYSSYKISLKTSSEYILHGNSFVNVSIESALAYNLKVEIGNKTYHEFDSGSVRINSFAVPNGTSNITATAENIAGYSSEISSIGVIDNSIPLLNLSPTDGSDIGNVTNFLFSASDQFGVSDVYVSFLGNNISVLPSADSFTLNFGNYSGIVNITIEIVDGYGISTRFDFQYRVIGFSNGNFSINIYNGEYFNSSTVFLSWSPVNNVSHYILNYGYAGNNTTLVTNLSSILLNLCNGKFFIMLKAFLLDNETKDLYSGSIFVEAFSPEIIIINSSDAAYSFYGNSLNDSFTFSMHTNVSSQLHIIVRDPDGYALVNVYTANEYWLNISRYSQGYSLNGNYSIAIEAVSLSHLVSQKNFTFYVNNTLPESPDLTYEDCYFNSSRNITMENVSNDLTYYYEEYFGNTRIHGGIAEGGIVPVDFSKDQGQYNISVEDVSFSGNYNYTNASFFYYTAKPTIELTAPNADLVKSAAIAIEYQIIDEAPLKEVALLNNGKMIVINNSAKSGSFNLQFDHNGQYQISMHVIDYAGNFNVSRNLTVNVSYFTSISSGEITSEISGNIGRFSIALKGNGTSNANISWYLNGKLSGYGDNVKLQLKYGKNDIKAIVSYDSKTVTYSKSIWVVGYLPLYFIPAISAIAISTKMIVENRNADELAEIISKHNGRKIKDLYVAARKRRFSKRNVRKAIQRMRNEGTLRIETDPNNHLYIMFNDQE